MAKVNEKDGRYENSFYGMGRIVADLSDTSTLYISSGTGQSGCITSKYYYDSGPKHAKGVYSKLS